MVDRAPPGGARRRLCPPPLRPGRAALGHAGPHRAAHRGQRAADLAAPTGPDDAGLAQFEEALASTVSRLRGLVDCDVTACSCATTRPARWVVAPRRGHGHARIVWPTTNCPPRSSRNHEQRRLAGGLSRPWRGRRASSLPLRPVRPAPGPWRTVGLVALEHHAPGLYGRRELGLLDGFIEPAALAIDNARWFARLRAMGADQERTRIARDMHDRVGQSLAGVAFRLDSLTRRAAANPCETTSTGCGRKCATSWARCGTPCATCAPTCPTSTGLADTLQGFLERVDIRNDMDVHFDNESFGRLPLARERELWRIAHEAITNVERHAGAEHLGSSGRATAAVPSSSSRTTVGASPPAGTAGSTPTGSSGCGSGRMPSGPVSRSSPARRAPIGAAVSSER